MWDGSLHKHIHLGVEKPPPTHAPPSEPYTADMTKDVLCRQCFFRSLRGINHTFLVTTLQVLFNSLQAEGALLCAAAGPQCNCDSLLVFEAEEKNIIQSRS